MSDLIRTRHRHLVLMGQTLDILHHVLGQVDATTATTLRDPNDGDKGWTVTEVVGHLVDFDGIFRHRVEMMRDQDTPELPYYDHEALAVEHRYNERDLKTLLQELSTSRAQTIAVFEALSDAQWQRNGIHPERDPFDMDDAVMQVGTHDVTHIEQITRILVEGK